jgi:hypothetical protein
MYMLSRFRSANRLLPHDPPILPTINIKYATAGANLVSNFSHYFAKTNVDPRKFNNFLRAIRGWALKMARATRKSG